MKRAGFAIGMLLLSMALIGCTSHSNFELPTQLAFQKQTKKSPLKIGIYVSPETKKRTFDQCEQLIGGSQCYHTNPGSVLEPNALRAYQQAFRKVVLLKSPENDKKSIDVNIELSLNSDALKTTLDGSVAYRTVTVELKLDILSYGKKLDSRSFKASTNCKAYQCNVDGEEKGLSSGEVLLNTLFTPGYIAGYSDRLNNVVNTAYSASLKRVLVESADFLKNYRKRKK